MKRKKGVSEDDNNRIDAPESSYLYISASQLPDSGLGLHTAINIYKDEIITYFKGEIITDAQAVFRAKRNNDRYFISMPDGLILDSMKRKCFAKYANDAQGYANLDHKNNSRIILSEDLKVCLVATRNIKSGEEIFCGYGKKYWEKHGVGK